MRKLERMNLQQERRGEESGVTKKGQKVKIYWEKRQKDPPNRQKCENWRAGAGEEESH